MTYFQFTINRSGLRFFTIFFSCSLFSSRRRLFSRCCCIPHICVWLQHGNRKQNKSLTPDSKCFYAKRTAPNILYTKYFDILQLHTKFISKQFPFPSFDPIKCFIKWLAHAGWGLRISNGSPTAHLQCIPLIDCSHHIHQSIVSVVTRGDVCTLLLMNKLDWHFA